MSNYTHISRRKRQTKGPFVKLPLSIMRSRAWITMSPEGRLLWIELRSRLRNDGLNNGKIFRSCRDAAKELGLNKDTVARRYAENEHYGFLRKTGEGFLGSDGRGIAARYRFTDLAYGTHAATRDHETWDGSIFEYAPPRPSRKKQNPVLPRRTPRPTASDIRKTENGGAVCPTASDIEASLRCPTASDTSRLPVVACLLGPSAGTDQGSSTARAPAQAGGAGSSPAPDANLTEMVLEIVRDQLDRLARPKLPWSTPTVVEVTDPVEARLIRQQCDGLRALCQ
jgi:hypothetical protein